MEELVLVNYNAVDKFKSIHLLECDLRNALLDAWMIVELFIQPCHVLHIVLMVILHVLLHLFVEFVIETIVLELIAHFLQSRQTL